MTRIDGLQARLRELEHAEGWIVLDDGSKFKPRSGIVIMRHQLKLRRDLGREPSLSDYPPDIQDEIRQFAKWTPDPSRNGQISILVVELSKKLTGIA